VDFQHTFHYETAHAADTYKELLQIPLNANNSILTNLIAQNKVGSSTNISVKIQYLDPHDGTTTTDLEIVETKALATTITTNLLEDAIKTSSQGEGLHIPAGAKIFVKTSVLNSINLVANVKHYNNIL
jgi:hypothetical protein